MIRIDIAALRKEDRQYESIICKDVFIRIQGEDIFLVCDSEKIGRITYLVPSMFYSIRIREDKEKELNNAP